MLDKCEMSVCLSQEGFPHTKDDKRLVYLKREWIHAEMGPDLLVICYRCLNYHREGPIYRAAYDIISKNEALIIKVLES